MAATEAGGTTTLKLVSNAGPFPLYMIKNDSIDTAEGVSLPSTAPFTTSSKIVIVGALNADTESQLADGEMTIEYVAADKQFVLTESGASGDTVRILFHLVQE